MSRKRGANTVALSAVIRGSKTKVWCAINRVTHTIYPNSVRPTRAACGRFILESGIRATHRPDEV